MLLEPACLDRVDGHDLDPYARRKFLILDAACIDMFGPSNMICCTLQARAAANVAEPGKLGKYSFLRDRFDFQPIAVKTSGMSGESALVFLHNLRNRIVSAMDDVRERTWLILHISLAVLRGNAISIAMYYCHVFLPHE